MRVQNLYINSQIINPQWSSHKYFSTELSPILLDVHDSLKKLGTMGATSRTGTICVIYKFKLHKFRLENLHYNPEESYAKNLRCNYC